MVSNLGLYWELRFLRHNIRNCNHQSKVHKHSLSESLMGYMHGRKGTERRDSVTDEILLDRKSHIERLQRVNDIPSIILKHLGKLGFGSKKRRSTFQSIVAASEDGAAVHLSSASNLWPLFKHVLPEIALAGHSNCGKSTLVNIMAGFPARKGPAGVSDRAGWTDQICFYQIGKRPPLLIMADLPGYGHAVASSDDMRAWKEMTRDYIGGRMVLSRCYVLVDCTRGLCPQDYSFLKFLDKTGVSWQVLLTKCDLLSLDDLARSLICVERDLTKKFMIETSYPWDLESTDVIDSNCTTESPAKRCYNHRLVIPVSANTGAGIPNLWGEIIRVVDDTSVQLDEYLGSESHHGEKVSKPLSPKSPEEALSRENNESVDAEEILFKKLSGSGSGSRKRDPRVREHVNAPLLRKNYFVNTYHKLTKAS